MHGDNISSTTKGKPSQCLLRQCYTAHASDSVMISTRDWETYGVCPKSTNSDLSSTKTQHAYRLSVSNFKPFMGGMHMLTPLPPIPKHLLTPLKLPI